MVYNIYLTASRRFASVASKQVTGSSSTSKTHKKKLAVRVKDLQPMSPLSAFYYERRKKTQSKTAASSGNNAGSDQKPPAVDGKALSVSESNKEYAALSQSEKFKHEIQSLASHWVIYKRLDYMSRLKHKLVLDRGSPYKVFIREKILMKLKAGETIKDGIRGVDEFRQMWRMKKDELLPVYAQKILDMEVDDFDKGRYNRKELSFQPPVKTVSAFSIFVKDLHQGASEEAKQKMYQEAQAKFPDQLRFTAVNSYQRELFRALPAEELRKLNERLEKDHKEYAIAEKEMQFNLKLTDAMILAYNNCIEKARKFEEFVSNYDDVKDQIVKNPKNSLKSQAARPYSLFVKEVFQSVDADGNFKMLPDLDVSSLPIDHPTQLLTKITPYIGQKWKSMSDEEKKQYFDEQQKETQQLNEKKANFNDLLVRVKDDFQIKWLTIV
ncbi:hypothetical protein MP228_001495 [Amoeboaphelidium protococcarum]|nr:hypothetical protein MP228_001495 [Amoeboaphelidium protococcarum]